MSTTSTTSQPLCIAVLSASDTRTPTDDRSGDLIRTSLQKVGHQIYCHEIIREDFDILKNRVASLIDEPTVEVADGVAELGSSMAGAAHEQSAAQRMEINARPSCVASIELCALMYVLPCSVSLFM